MLQTTINEIREYRRNGFTLVEVLIYAAILALFIGAVFAFTSTILGTADKLLERNELIAAQDFVDAKIRWLLTKSQSVTSPVPNTTSSILTFQGNDASMYPATFTFQSNAVWLSLGAATSTVLTNNRVYINSFSAEHYSNAQSTSTLRVIMTLRSAIYPAVQSSTTLLYTLFQ